MSNQLKDLLEETKVAALVFETYREKTPHIVTAIIGEVFGNIKKALALLDVDPCEFTKDIRLALEQMTPDGKFHRKIMAKACALLDQQHAENKQQYDKGFLEGVEAQEKANRKHIIGPLEAENKQLKRVADAAGSLLLDVQQDCVKLQAKNKRLKAFIEKYPSHDTQCAIFADIGRECDCGYEQAKNEAIKETQ